jgi:hypothetical protein
MIQQIKEKVSSYYNPNLVQLYAKYYLTIVLIILGIYLVYEYIFKTIFPNLLTPKKIDLHQNKPDKTTTLEGINTNNIKKSSKNDNDNNNNDSNDNKQLTSSNKLNTSSYEDDIYFVYWTGGYDSTFRLCEMLIKEKKMVQPLYVSLSLDNDCLNEETCNKVWFRKNRKYEKKAMNTIRKKLNKKFPYTKETLLPTIYIDEEIDDTTFNKQFEEMFYQDNLWPKKRKKHQYLFLSKFAYYHKQYIDIGVLGIHHKSKFAKFLKKNLKKENTTLKIKGKTVSRNNYTISDETHFLHYLKFPIYNKTKEELYIIAERDGYHEILKYTWSCWFPNKDTGNPCGNCPMCKERVITHPKMTEMEQ